MNLFNQSRNNKHSIVFMFTQAVARGLKDPSFRVIQNHFAISGNLGEVAAKVYNRLDSTVLLFFLFMLRPLNISGRSLGSYSTASRSWSWHTGSGILRVFPSFSSISLFSLNSCYFNLLAQLLVDI